MPYFSISKIKSSKIFKNLAIFLLHIFSLSLSLSLFLNKSITRFTSNQSSFKLSEKSISMALPSNKASASTIMSGRPNSSARNSETSNPIRRSFSGNPFTKPSVVTNPRGFNPNTPANSPSGLAFFHTLNFYVFY